MTDSIRLARRQSMLDTAPKNGGMNPIYSLLDMSLEAALLGSSKKVFSIYSLLSVGFVVFTLARFRKLRARAVENTHHREEEKKRHRDVEDEVTHPSWLSENSKLEREEIKQILVDSPWKGKARRKESSQENNDTVFLSFNTNVEEERNNEFFAFRLVPGTEVKSFLSAIVKEKNIKAGSIVSAVGSLKNSHLRLANASRNFAGNTLIKEEPHEVVSLSGTLCMDGNHVHVALSDNFGYVFGGHLLEAYVHTTLEIVCVKFRHVAFRREMDHSTGFKELTIVE